MATLISDALDALSSLRTSPYAQCKAIDELLGLVADLLAGKEPSQVKAWQEAQERFDGNVASVVLAFVSRTMAQMELRGDDMEAPTCLKLTRALSLLQGLLFLHPRSARLFERKANLETILAILKLKPSAPSTPGLATSVPETVGADRGAMVVQALATLLAALVDRPRSARAFEEAGGLADLTDILRSKEPTKEIRYACLEILFVYLGPEEQAAQGIVRTPSAAAGLSRFNEARHRQLDRTSSVDKVHRRASSTPALPEARPSTPTTPSTPTNPFLPPPTPSRPRTSLATPRHATPADERLRKMLEEADTSWAPTSPRKSRASGVEAPLMRSKKRPPSLVLDSMPPPDAVFSPPLEQDKAGLRASMPSRPSLGGAHHRRQSSNAPRHSGFMPSIPSMPSLASPAASAPSRSPLAPATSMPLQSPALVRSSSRSSYGGLNGPLPRTSSFFDPSISPAAAMYKPSSLSPSRSRRSLTASTPPASPSKRLSSLVQQATAHHIRPDPTPLVAASRHSSFSSSASTPNETPSRRASVGKPLASSPSKRGSLSASRPSLPQSPSKRASLGTAMPRQPQAMAVGAGMGLTTRTLEDKKALLAKHLGNVDALVETFKEAAVSLRV